MERASGINSPVSTHENVEMMASDPCHKFIVHHSIGRREALQQFGLDKNPRALRQFLGDQICHPVNANVGQAGFVLRIASSNVGVIAGEQLVNICPAFIGQQSALIPGTVHKKKDVLSHQNHLRSVAWRGTGPLRHSAQRRIGRRACVTAATNGVFMPRFYQPDLGANPDSPFVRDGNDKLIRRSYWLDMDDRTLVMLMTMGIGANLTNDEKRAHLIDIRREHLIDQVCPQEILPPEK
jgi:hypothetical protein